MRRASAIIFPVALLLALGLLLPYWLANRGLVLLADAAGTAEGGGLPPGTVVLNAAAATSISPPFVLREDAATATGVCVALPDAQGSAYATGQIHIAFELPEAGDYVVWTRVLWSDSCGNSLTFTLGTEEAEATRVVGQDAVYHRWHWIPAGIWQLAQGGQHLVVGEREDGVAIDQILLTVDPEFVPSGAVVAERDRGGEPRRVADCFTRSPGHGSALWDFRSGTWELAFCLDPNRVPDQYSLRGECAGDDREAVALLRGGAWRGCRFAFSYRVEPGAQGGLVLDRSADGSRGLAITFEVDEEQARLQVDGCALSVSVDTKDAIRPGQWHRVVVERWAGVLRVAVDGNELLARYDLMPGSGAVGLLVRKGVGIFDDVDVTEILWQAEDGGEYRMGWQVPPSARWFRGVGDRAPAALVGRSGQITSAPLETPVKAVVLAAEGGGAWPMTPGFSALAMTDSTTYLVPDKASVPLHTSVSLAVSEDEVRLRSVAIAYGVPTRDTFRLGPYRFDTDTIPDPADYLDFTPEEVAAMEASPDADKLRREHKPMPVVSERGERCVWRALRGRWEVRDGALAARGPNASARFWQEISCAMEVHLRFRLPEPTSVAEVSLYKSDGDAIRIRLVRDGNATVADGAGTLPAVPDDAWHELAIRTVGADTMAHVNDGPWQTLAAKRGEGGGIYLGVPAGTAEFDDFEIHVPRAADGEFFYAFDRRETDWWHSGGQWVDHAGIACAVASNWISLIAAEGEGVIWNKRLFASDLAVAFNIEEHTDWLGWTHDPSHIHYPFDNIQAVLGTDADRDRGYRLEVNARDRTATVLYRNGVEVARVRQGAAFPIVYQGGHAPYRPRRNRITLAKRGAEVRAEINGQEVLVYTDPSPLPVRRVGVGGYRTRINFSRIIVRELGPR